jgi:hypothetical protein
MEIVALSSIAATMDGKKYGATKLELNSVPDVYKALVEEIKSKITRDSNDPANPACTFYGLSTKTLTQIVCSVPVEGFENSFIQYIGYANPTSQFAPITIGKLYGFNGSNYGTAVLIAPFNNEAIMYMTGSVAQLGMWNGDYPLQMTLGYSRAGLYWYIYIPVIFGKQIEYKYLYAPGNWESGDNQTYTPTRENLNDSTVALSHDIKL